MNAAVFLDRDGVLNEDVHLLTRADQVRVFESVPRALRLLREAGFKLVVISNQTVVARGMITEEEVVRLQAQMERLIAEAGGPALDGFYFCPHHPNATLTAYRVVCQCRKPQAGLLRRAAQEQNLDLKSSFMVGDRPSDVIAGMRAGCRTVQVRTGRHWEPPIETGEPPGEPVRPEYICADLQAAAEWILKAR